MFRSKNHFVAFFFCTSMIYEYTHRKKKYVQLETYFFGLISLFINFRLMTKWNIFRMTRHHLVDRGIRDKSSNGIDVDTMDRAWICICFYRHHITKTSITTFDWNPWSLLQNMRNLFQIHVCPFDIYQSEQNFIVIKSIQNFNFTLKCRNFSHYKWCSYECWPMHY